MIGKLSIQLLNNAETEKARNLRVDGNHVVTQRNLRPITIPTKVIKEMESRMECKPYANTRMSPKGRYLFVRNRIASIRVNTKITFRDS